MAKVKTGELTGPALDWAVAKADDNLHPKGDVRLLDGKVFTIEAGDYERSDRWQRYSPSTVWAQAGPILERERIAIGYGHYVWNAAKYGLGWYVGGPTPLVAAMRCYAASKLGSEIEVPEALS